MSAPKITREIDRGAPHGTGRGFTRNRAFSRVCVGCPPDPRFRLMIVLKSQSGTHRRRPGARNVKTEAADPRASTYTHAYTRTRTQRPPSQCDDAGVASAATFMHLRASRRAGCERLSLSLSSLLFPSMRRGLENREGERPAAGSRSFGLPDALRLKLNRGSLLPRGPPPRLPPPLPPAATITVVVVGAAPHCPVKACEKPRNVRKQSVSPAKD